MLPALTSADLVAVWRRAALRWQEDEAKESPENTAPALVGAEARTAMSALFPRRTGCWPIGNGCCGGCPGRRAKACQERPPPRKAAIPPGPASQGQR
ncbi:hypothetical protein ACFQU7_21860 [Pseudoroseomonas wenyumeiae]